MVAGSNLTAPYIYIKGQAQYVNVPGSEHWKGVYRVGDRDQGCKIFLIGF